MSTNPRFERFLERIIPASSGWTLTALTAAIGAAATIVLRRHRNR